MNTETFKRNLMLLVAVIVTGVSCNHPKTPEANAKQPENSTLDSASKKWFEQYTKRDSIEIIAEETVDVDSPNPKINRITYIDYRSNNQDKQSALAHEKELLSYNSGSSPQTFHGENKLVLNPSKELNGSYCQLIKFRGKFITGITYPTFNIYSITDSGVVMFQETWGDVLYPYDSVFKNDNTFTCFYSQMGAMPDEKFSGKLEIKTLGKENKMQIWKIDNNCLLMMPLKYAVNLPAVYFDTNCGCVDDEMKNPPAYDAINEDSIFAKW